MAQRKFLRQVSSYLNEDTLYPRLFVVDLNYDPSSSSQVSMLQTLLTLRSVVVRDE